MTMKLIVLGLDGFSPHFFKKWEADLPHLKTLIKNGVYGTLESTIPPTTLPAWVSMFTGKTFSNIEAFGLVNLDRTYGLKPVDPLVWKGEYVWDILSENGITVGIFSLPFLSCAYKVHGFMITDPVIGDDMYPLNTIQLDIDRDQLPSKEKEVRWHIFYQKPHLFKKLAEKNYDFYFFLISISDVMMHLGGEKELKKAYKEIDKKIIPVITRICEEHQYNLLIVSDHGSKKTYKKFNINTFLKKKGYLTTESTHKEITGLIQKVIESLPIEIVRILRDIYGRTRTGLFPRIQYETTTAFGSGAGNTSYCGVWLNKKGVFKKGIVKKEESILTQLLTDLKGVKEIEAVFTREELGYSDAIVFPDIVIKTSDDIAVYFPVFPSVLHKSEEIVHSRSGIVIAYGPQVNQSTRIEHAKINDIAPTILHFFGLPIPRTKGDVLTEIFKSKKPPEYVDSDYYKKKQEDKKIKKAVKTVKSKKV